MTQYKFRCLQCGKRFRKEAALSAHQKTVHHKHIEVKKHIEHREREIKQLQKKLPGSRTNWLGIIIFLILIALFIYFVYLR